MKAAHVDAPEQPTPIVPLSPSTPNNFHLPLESIAVFAIGVLLMTFIYDGTGGVLGNEIGVPGHDSFYHIKMATIIPEHGLLRQLPWLQFCYFTDEGQEFISHHYGFHALLIPFVQLSHYLTGDALAGGRWAICTIFGLNLLLFNLLLKGEGIRWRALWIALFILLPYQFFTRHAFIRAISPSLMFILLILLFAFQNRAFFTALAVACYTHLYLGGVIYAPLVIALFAVAHLLGLREYRVFPWRVLIAAVIAWTIGVFTHPYAHGMVEFLWLQIFGSGLAPDIPVGREWKPYNNVWWFAAEMSGPLLVAWTLALIARLRLQKPLDPKAMSLLLLNVAFLVLTLKARRFIEYWPVLCLLSAAFLAKPDLNRFAEWLERDESDTTSRRDRRLRIACDITGILIVLLFGVIIARFDEIRENLRRLAMAWQPWAVIGIYFAITGVRSWSAPRRSRLAAGLRATAFACGLVVATATLAANPLIKIQKESRCRYDLPAIREMMAFLKTHSEPGDVVFTDDWDIFPVFFYYNSHNHYIVGLDPKFTHQRRPDLWERYVKISRGQVPSDTQFEKLDDDGRPYKVDIHVELTDIRDHFDAGFVITDRNHKALARKLIDAPIFAELIYPASSYDEAKNAPYLIFRIRPSTPPTGVMGDTVEAQWVALSRNDPQGSCLGSGEPANTQQPNTSPQSTIHSCWFVPSGDHYRIPPKEPTGNHRNHWE